jgi:hypothetical protein
MSGLGDSEKGPMSTGQITILIKLFLFDLV